MIRERNSMTFTSAYLVFLIFFFVFFFPMALGVGLYWYEKKSGMDELSLIHI